MQTKKKICKRCETEKYIFARGMCKTCDMVTNPKKYLINRRESTKPKEKKESITSLKKKLDAVFSLYIRQKYEVNGIVECYTCGTIKPVKSMQNGHFWSRSHLSVRWNEDNCRVQCSGCNVFKHGNYIVYTRKLLKEIGNEEFLSLEQRKNIPFSPTRDWLKAQIEYYTFNIKK